MRRMRRKAIGFNAGDTSASPMLVYIVMLLLGLLAIKEIDLHREGLHAVGMVIHGDGFDPKFAGP
ncbi:hypothetical protein AFEL58S_02945 [Afipia felis]